jgi:sortase A
VSYIYVKQESKTPRRRLGKVKKKTISICFLLVGIFLFSSAIFPILRFQLEYSLKFKQTINPLSNKYYNNSGNILGDMSTDYTQLANWFVEENSDASAKGSQILRSGSLTSYKLTIPSLKISDAIVEVGSMDLKKSLIQYPQTALPGQLGNAVVFGHSVLPQFFNPKSYLTIFSTLFRLKQGDDIKIDFDGVEYKYKIEEMYEVQPTDLSVLEQRYDGKYLTLITCSPPGTYLRRLVIKARIIDN